MSQVRSRLGRWASAAAVLVVGLPTSAADPVVAPVSRVEIYHGTTKIPVPPAADWAPQTYPTPAPLSTAVEVAPMPTAEPRLVPAGGPLHADHSATSSGAVERAPAMLPQHQTVVVIREPAPAAAAAPLSAPQPPTVVVVRETEPRAVATAPSTAEWWLPAALGLGLLFVAGAIAFRRPAAIAPATATTPAPPVAPAAPPEAPPETRTVGGYDIGPAPKSAQKFDLGPSFAEERQSKEHQEEQQGAAVLEFVLNQNLAFHDALEAAERTPAEPVENTAVWVDRPAC